MFYVAYYSIAQKNLTIDLPEAFVGRQVEILAFIIDKTSSTSNSASKTFTSLKLDTRNFKFNREAANRGINIENT